MNSNDITPAHQYAYRYLIYEGTLSIRRIEWVGTEWWERWNLIYWLRRRQQICNAGQVANWLHNLALFSATNFDRFNETAFWSQLDYMKKKSPDDDFGRFRNSFLYAVFQFNEGRWPTLDEQSVIAANDHQ